MAHPLPPGHWAPAVHRMLCTVLETAPAGSVAALDFDHTCIAGDISHALLRQREADTGENLWSPYQADCAADTETGYAKLSVTLLRGMTPDEAVAYATDGLARAVRERSVGFSSDMAHLVAAMADRGWTIWVITASASPLVIPAAAHYGLRPQQVVGLDPELTHGRFGERVPKPRTYREGKATHLMRVAGRPPTLAFGDSTGDAAMMALASNAVFVDHGDAEMSRLATEHGWLTQPGWTCSF